MKRRRLLAAQYDVRSPQHEHHSHIYSSISATVSSLFFRHTSAGPCSIVTDDSVLISTLLQQKARKALGLVIFSIGLRYVASAVESILVAETVWSPRTSRAAIRERVTH